MKKRYVITASTFDRKGNLIASRNNSYTKSHPLMKHFGTIAGESYRISLHAEIAAIIASKDKIIDSLVVTRYDCNGNFKIAKPCKTCQAAIKAYNIPNVYYSTEEGMKKL